MPAKIVRTLDEILAYMETGPPPTPDDVCVDAEGRRLGTPEKLRAWIDEVNEARAAALARGEEVL
jgi:hypothetical protein